MPLAHPPGHAQVDFGECVGDIGSVRMKLHVFCFDLPQSDACFIKAYAAETTEAFLDGQVSAFAFFGGVPLSILYDNLKIAVAKILAAANGGERKPLPNSSATFCSTIALVVRARATTRMRSNSRFFKVRDIFHLLTGDRVANGRA